MREMMEIKWKNGANTGFWNRSIFLIFISPISLISSSPFLIAITADG